MRSGLRPDQITIALREAQEIVEHVDIFERRTDNVSFGKA
jgi:hypothetical protein